MCWCTFVPEDKKLGKGEKQKPRGSQALRSRLPHPPIIPRPRKPRKPRNPRHTRSMSVRFQSNSKSHSTIVTLYLRTPDIRGPPHCRDPATNQPFFDTSQQVHIPMRSSSDPPHNTSQFTSGSPSTLACSRTTQLTYSHHTRPSLKFSILMQSTSSNFHQQEIHSTRSTCSSL